jgi:hypothetical protein
MLDLSLSYDCLMITSYRWQKSYILYLKKEWWQKSYILYLKKEWLSYLCLWASKEYSVALMTTASCHEVYWSRLSFLKDTVNAVTNIVFVTRHPCTRLSHNKLQLRTHSLSWYQLQSILLLRLWEFNSKILWKLVKQSIPKTTTNFRPRPNKPRNFFFSLNMVMMAIKRILFRYRFQKSQLILVTKCTQNKIFWNKDVSGFFRGT